MKLLSEGQARRTGQAVQHVEGMRAAGDDRRRRRFTGGPGIRLAVLKGDLVAGGEAQAALLQWNAQSETLEEETTDPNEYVTIYDRLANGSQGGISQDSGQRVIVAPDVSGDGWMVLQTTFSCAPASSIVVWTPESLSALQAWGSGSSINPQALGTDNFLTWPAVAGSPDLDTLNGTPNVIASADSDYAVQFTRTDSDRVIATGATITKASAGVLWATFKLNSGYSSGVNHGLVSVGGSASSTRQLVLRLWNTGGSLYPSLYISESTNTRNYHADAALADTDWHSLVAEYDGSAHHLFLDGAEVACTDVTAGTPPTWLASWHASVTPNRLGVACNVGSSTPADHGDVKIADWGLSADELNSDEASLLAYLEAKRGA